MDRKEKMWRMTSTGRASIVPGRIFLSPRPKSSTIRSEFAYLSSFWSVDRKSSLGCISSSSNAVHSKTVFVREQKLAPGTNARVTPK